ncbi:hypothetical protein D3C85_1487930 [compost metagenome]
MFVTSKKRLTQSNPKLVISTKETTAIATREANPCKKLDKVSFMFIIPKAKPAQSNSNLVISTKETRAIATGEANPRKKLDKDWLLATELLAKISPSSK